MSRISVERLSELVADVLDRSWSMVSDPSDAAAAAGQGFEPTRSVRIAYSGEESGFVCVLASDGFLEELSSCHLDCEPEEVDLALHGPDALGELANIVAGSVLRELGGDTREFELGLPEERAITVPRAGVECYLESTYGAVRVCWWPDQHVGSRAA